MTMAMRLFLTMVLLLGLAAPASAGPVPVAPEATSYPLGRFTLVALRDERNVVPNDGSVFGKDVGPQTVAAALKAAGAPTDRVALAVDALLVREPERTILIDTGLGPKVGGVLMRSLTAAHVAPQAITDVLITHSHGDHVGGLLSADGRLAFPNASVRMSAPEWSYLRGNPGMRALADAIAPKVRTFAPGAEVVPGITSVAIPGHTPGHVGYWIASEGHTLLDFGDTVHSAIVSLAHPEWTIGYDGDPALGRKNREAMLATLAADHALVFAPHLPFPGIGRVEKAATGYRWVPAR